MCNFSAFRCLSICLNPFLIMLMFLLSLLLVVLVIALFAPIQIPLWWSPLIAVMTISCLSERAMSWTEEGRVAVEGSKNRNWGMYWIKDIHEEGNDSWWRIWKWFLNNMLEYFKYEAETNFKKSEWAPVHFLISDIWVKRGWALDKGFNISWYYTTFILSLQGGTVLPTNERGFHLKAVFHSPPISNNVRPFHFPFQPKFRITQQRRWQPERRIFCSCQQECSNIYTISQEDNFLSGPWDLGKCTGKQRRVRNYDI